MMREISALIAVGGILIGGNMEVLATETHYSFLISGATVGDQVVRDDGKSISIETRFTTNGETVRAFHAYRYDQNLQVREYSTDGKEWMKATGADVYPSSAYEVVIRRLRLTPKQTVSFQQINESNGLIMNGPHRFEVDSEIDLTNSVTGSSSKLFKVVEYAGSEPRRWFLVDQQHRIHLADWQGAQSIVQSQDK